MTTINQLSAMTAFASSDKLVVWQTLNGDTRTGTVALLADYMATALAVTPTTVALLPSAATAGAGARAFVTDANATTFASVVAGSGANGVPVYSDGTNWRIG